MIRLKVRKGRENMERERIGKRRRKAGRRLLIIRRIVYVIVVGVRAK